MESLEHGQQWVKNNLFKVKEYGQSCYVKFDQATDINRTQPTIFRPFVRCVAVTLEESKDRINSTRELVVKRTSESVSPRLEKTYKSLVENPEIFAYSMGLLGVSLAMKSGPKRMLLAGTVGSAAGVYALASLE